MRGRAGRGCRGLHPSGRALAGEHRRLLSRDDGRRPQDAGMTLRQTAELMLALGARDAVNLDGGGSTRMVVADSSGCRSGAES
ncbi:MAG TPA: phosphodiester glycosidase family protein [Gemmatimonadales bacterium]|nr:phosphodiester glycosidase family protein [Gemmatimonadales bacterium]